jgi:hypothetical protein
VLLILNGFYEIAEEPDFWPPFIRKKWAGQTPMRAIALTKQNENKVYKVIDLQAITCHTRDDRSGL